MNNVSSVGLVGDGIGPRTPNKKSGSAAGRYFQLGMCSHSKSSPTVMLVVAGSLLIAAGVPAEVNAAGAPDTLDPGVKGEVWLRPVGSSPALTALGVSRSLNMIASSNRMPRISIFVSTSTVYRCWRWSMDAINE